jgi:hypothetical protein
MLTSQAPAITSTEPRPTGRTVRLPVLASDPPGDDWEVWATGEKLVAAELERLLLSGRAD